jgi:hypothetical protein
LKHLIYITGRPAGLELDGERVRVDVFLEYSFRAASKTTWNDEEDAFSWEVENMFGRKVAMAKGGLKV